MAVDRETQAASPLADAPPERKPFAWQPLTRRGVASFAYASTKRLFLAQLLVALVSTATVVWFLQQAWFPVFRESIDHLPADGTLQSGVLQWSGDPTQVLAEGPFLAFALDLHHRGEARSPAHVAVELGERDLKIFSLFGFYTLSYSKTWTTPFNRQELLPWWGAWEPAILGIVALTLLITLILCWQILAAVYTIPAWLVAFFANRELSLSQSWRLAGAALMPGALFLTSMLLLYGLGVIDFIHVVLAAALHFVIGWIYVIASPFTLRLVARETPRNPFTQGAAQKGPSTPTTTPQ